MGVLVGTVLLAAAPQVTAATPTTGVWIFPHAKRTAALADSLDDSFYTGDIENPWLQDSYFADAGTDGATVQVDLYNPTGSDLFNVQVFAAYSVDNLNLVTSIAFSGGQSGDLSYSGSDLESGGTPQMAGGVAIDGHDVYPAYFVSYGVGDLDAGSAGILSFTIAIVGDFANALIVHLDYTAVDADGNGVSGPFEADMNIFDNGDTETPPCDPSPLQIHGNMSADYTPGSGVTLNATLELVEPFVYEKSDVRATLHTGSVATVVEASEGKITDGVWSWDITQVAQVPINATVNLSGSLGPLALAGDVETASASVSWTDCDGDHTATADLSATVAHTPTGDARNAGWWADQIGKCKQGKSVKVGSGLNNSQVDKMLQAIAAHSDIFTYGAWKGTAPDGTTDAGSVDIGSCAKVLKVLEKKTDESKKVRGAEREGLALWLNVATGAVNLDTQLAIYEKKHKCKGSHTEFEDQTGEKSLSSAYDTPAEILAFLEKQVRDWQDGQGASKSDLKLAKRLARSVNSEWLVAA